MYLVLTYSVWRLHPSWYIDMLLIPFCSGSVSCTGESNKPNKLPPPPSHPPPFPPGNSSKPRTPTPSNQRHPRYRRSQQQKQQKIPSINTCLSSQARTTQSKRHGRPQPESKAILDIPISLRVNPFLLLPLLLHLYLVFLPPFNTWLSTRPKASLNKSISHLAEFSPVHP